MEAGTSIPPAEAGSGYSAATVAGAAMATVLFPFFTLIAALLLRGGVRDSRKRSQLRSWAWLSAGWLVLEAVVWLLLQSVTFN